MITTGGISGEFAWNAHHNARFDEWMPFDPEVRKPPDISEENNYG
jgi:hypothetical protein